MCVVAAGAGIAAAGAVGSAVIGSNASQSAADTQAAAANNASQAQLAAQQDADRTELQMFNQTQANLQPFMQSGQTANNALLNFLGLGGYGPASQTGMAATPFQWNPAADPLFNFELETGQNAITNSAASLGGVNSGATLRALQDYGQQTAQTSYQTEFNNWNTNLNRIFQQLASVSGTGQNAAANLGGLATSVGGQVGNNAINTAAMVGGNTIGAGNAAAAGTIGSANALGGGIQSFFNSPGFTNALNTLTSSGAGGGGFNPYYQSSYSGFDNPSNYG